MDQTGEYTISADREAVWQALNDPDVLAQCIDGCQAMRQLAPDRFEARVKARVGPVNANFDLKLSLRDIVPPSSYHIDAQVKGGPAGFAKGSADIELQDVSAAPAPQTRLRYAVTASIGGKLAQVGSRLIDGAARKMADDFFAAFTQRVGAGVPIQATAAGAEAETSADHDASSDASNEATDKPDDDVIAVAPGPGQAPTDRGQWLIWAIVFAVLALAMVLAL